MAYVLRGKPIDDDAPADGDVLVYDSTTKTWLLEGDVITEINKIDSSAVSGLAGTADSLAYKVHEIESHFHSPEQWFGKAAGDSYLDRDSLTPWRITAGNSEAYGTLVRISDGTEIESGSTSKKFDFHRIIIAASSANAAYKVEVYSPTTADLLTEFIYQGQATLRTAPIELMADRVPCNSSIWLRCKCATNAATLDFKIGVHTYVG